MVSNTSMSSAWLVQCMTTAQSQQEAVSILRAMVEQSDYRGGRIIPPRGQGWWELVEPPQVWKVQTLHEDCGEENANQLPEGVRRVLVLPSMFTTFGMR